MRACTRWEGEVEVWRCGREAGGGGCAACTRWGGAVEVWKCCSVEGGEQEVKGRECVVIWRCEGVESCLIGNSLSASLLLTLPFPHSPFPPLLRCHHLR